MPVPQIVIDTNVLISAQRSRRGASARLVSLIGAGLFDVHVSVPLVLEYELAVKARCSRIITFNKRDFVGSEKFGVDVMPPKALLQEIGDSS